MEEENQPSELIPPLDPPVAAADSTARYQYDDPDYIQVDRRSAHAVSLFAVFIMIVISAIAFVVKKPYFPEIYVSSFDVSSFILSSNASSSSSSSPVDVFTVNLAFRNPNRVIGIKFRHQILQPSHISLLRRPSDYRDLAIPIPSETRGRRHAS